MKQIHLSFLTLILLASTSNSLASAAIGEDSVSITSLQTQSEHVLPESEAVSAENLLVEDRTTNSKKEKRAEQEEPTGVELEKEKKPEPESSELSSENALLAGTASAMIAGEGFGEMSAPYDPETFLKGLQGQYETDLFTGSATFTYPLWIPPGRNGIQPSLDLRYSSSMNNLSSLVGLGWSLPQSAIYRSTPKGVFKLYTEDDFSAEIFGDYNELIVTDAAKQEYAAKTESEFRKYTFANGSWAMVDTTGTVYTFGSSAAARQADPNDPSRVYKWMLEEVEDTNGNYMTFTYFIDNGQVYPDTIRYTSNGLNPGLYEIRFIRTANANPKTSYRSGFKIGTDYVISEVEIYSYATGNAQLLRTYEFGYGTTDYVTNLLESVTTKAGTLSLPPIEFDYYPSGPSYGLLNAITYPAGGKQTLTYKSSTAYRTPAQTLANIRLPFVIQTVHTSAMQDGLQGGTHTTTYDYSGSHYYFDTLDAFTREYAGFYEVSITDAGGNVRSLYFHQSEFSEDNTSSVLMGEFEDHISKKGRIFRDSTFDNSGNLYQVTMRKWDKDVLADDNTEWDRYFPKLTRETTATYDGDADYKATSHEYVYDQYGNVTQVVDYGEVMLLGNNGTYSDSGADKLTTDIAYTENTTDYIVALPKTEQLRDHAGTLISETRSYYDGSSTLGNVTQGNLTKSDQLVEVPNTYVTTELTYNSYGLPTTFTNPRSYDTTIAYDTHTLYPATITNAKNQDSEYEYDYRFGVVAKETDPNGMKKETTLDALGRVVEIRTTDPGLSTSQAVIRTYSYNTTSIPNSVTATAVFDPDATPAADGESDVITYLDGFGRVIQVRTEAEGPNQYVRNNFMYDERGNVQKEMLPVFSPGSSFQSISGNEKNTRFDYDPMNRITAITNPVGTTATVYDQWEQQVTNPNGNRKDYVFDARRNLAEVREYLGTTAHSTIYNHDGLGNLLRITDAKANVREMTYDLLGRRLSLQDLHTSNDTTFGTWTFSYDENGNLSSQTDPKGQTIDYTYDQLDRILTEDFAGNGGTEVDYSYDTGTYGIGRLSAVGSPSSEKEFTYDVLGRVTAEDHRIDGTTYSTHYTYDLIGNIETMTYPDSMQVSYSYNDAGLLESVQKNSSNVVTNIDYAPIALVSQIDYSNGVRTSNTYDMDEIYRLTGRKTTKGTTDLQDIAYTFDASGNITQIVDDSYTNAAKTASYAYDELDRLTTATITNSPNFQDYTRTYTYDILGNVLSRSDSGTYTYAGGDSSTSVATNSNPHAVTNVAGVGYSYDDNGNLVSNSTWTHSWDYKDRLLSSTNGTDTVEYAYDEGGNRVTKENTTSGKMTVYVSKYHDIEDSTPKNHIYAGEMKIATETEVDDGQGGTTKITVFHHEDHLTGSNVDTDDGGHLLELSDYFPFGDLRLEERAGAYENDYEFTGKELDEDTGLYYYEARYYDSAIGRFVSLDPWFGDVSDPQSLNKYSYVRNNPMNYVDPTGEVLAHFLRELGRKIVRKFSRDYATEGMEDKFFDNYPKAGGDPEYVYDDSGDIVYHEDGTPLLHGDEEGIEEYRRKMSSDVEREGQGSSQSPPRDSEPHFPYRPDKVSPGYLPEVRVSPPPSEDPDRVEEEAVSSSDSEVDDESED